MPPEPTVQITWGIIKAAVVIETLKVETTTFREGIINVIDSLQTNPKPPEAIAETIGGITTFRIAVDTVTPPSYLSYVIQETMERVVITSIVRKQFS